MRFNCVRHYNVDSNDDERKWKNYEMMEHHFISSADVALELVFNFFFLLNSSKIIMHIALPLAVCLTRRDLFFGKRNEKKIQQKKKHIKNNDDDAEYLAFLSPKMCTKMCDRNFFVVMQFFAASCSNFNRSQNNMRRCASLQLL